jgi:hypothetical protein
MELYGSLWNLQHLCVYYATYEIWPFLWPKSGFADVSCLVNDCVLQATKRLRYLAILTGKNTPWIVAKDPTIYIEHIRHNLQPKYPDVFVLTGTWPQVKK